jgi:hypothetical protein
MEHQLKAHEVSSERDRDFSKLSELGNKSGPIPRALKLVRVSAGKKSSHSKISNQDPVYRNTHIRGWYKVANPNERDDMLTNTCRYAQQPAVRHRAISFSCNPYAIAHHASRPWQRRSVVGPWLVMSCEVEIQAPGSDPVSNIVGIPFRVVNHFKISSSYCWHRRAAIT